MNEDSVYFDLDALLARVDQDAGAPEFPAAAEALRRSGHAERARELAEAGLASAPSRLAGRVALALAEMDLGQPAKGRDQLERVLDEMLEPYRLDVEPEAGLTPVSTHIDVAEPDGFDGAPEPLAPVMDADSAAATGTNGAAANGVFDAVAEDEIEAAFDEAEARPEEMHSPNRMAESILDSEAPFEADAEADARESVTLDAEDAAEFDLASSGAFATHTMAGLLEQQGDHARARTIRTALDSDDVETTDETELAGDAADLSVDDEGAAAGEGATTDAVSEPDQHDPIHAFQESIEGPSAWAADADAAGFIEGDLAQGDDPMLSIDAERGLGARQDEESASGMDAAEVPDGIEAVPAQIEAEEAEHERVLATLEAWLHNLQRGVA